MQGTSFTLAGDDTINLEAVHVALSRGTQANHLYYMGEPPPHEDHHVAEATQPELETLVAAAGRSRAQIMALDLLQGAARSGGVDGTASFWTDAPMTEAQVATLARRGVVPEGDLTWIQASLHIDQVAGTPFGERATIWLRENGASAEDAAQVVERAKLELRGLRNGRPARAVGLRLEVLDGTNQLYGVRTRERDALRRGQAEAVRDRQRQRRRAWVQRTRAVENGPSAAANRTAGSRPPPRARR